MDWNIQNGIRRIVTPSISSAPALSITFTPEGKTVLTSALDFHLRQWDLEEGICKRVWKSNGPLFSIKIIPSGKTALLAAVQGVVCWDLEHWEHSSQNSLWSFCTILDLDYSEIRDEVWGAGENALIYRWNLSANQKLQPLSGQDCMVTALALDGAGKAALSGDLYGRLKLWDCESGLYQKTWQAHNEKISSIYFSKNGEFALSAGYEKDTRIWNLPAGECILIMDNQETLVNKAAFSPDEKLVFIGGDGGLKIYEFSSGKMLEEIKLNRMADFCLSPTDSSLAAIIRGNELLIWDFG